MKLPVPDRIKNKPTIKWGNEFYWKAYMDLTTERRIGMVEGPIPWHSVVEYARTYELDFFEFDDLWEVIKQMDCEYLKHRDKKLKSKVSS